MSCGENSLELLLLVATTSVFYQTEKMKVWAAVQIQSTARCPASVVSWWCTDKEETKHGETTVQVKFASKHYKSTTKLAPQNNIWQFLVALSHKKPWEIFVCSATSTHFCFMRNTRGLFKGLVLILGDQSCKKVGFLIFFSSTVTHRMPLFAHICSHLPPVVSSSNIWLCGPLFSGPM